MDRRVDGDGGGKKMAGVGWGLGASSSPSMLGIAGWSDAECVGVLACHSAASDQ